MCIVGASLKRDLRLKYQHLSFLAGFVIICVCLSVVQGKVRLWVVKEKPACFSGWCILYFETLKRQESVVLRLALLFTV